MSKDTCTSLEVQPSFRLVPMSSEISDIITEELDGLGTIPMDTVKIPSGGGLAFELPGEEEDKPVSATELTGIILYHHATNAWWRDSYIGGNQQPDCYSNDGHTGTAAETGETKNCAFCPYNQFGSGKDGGKACKNAHRVYMLLSGNPLPIILSLPPTSLMPLKIYLAKKVVIPGLRSWQVLTKVTLKKVKNAGGIAYSQAVFTKIGVLTEKELAVVQPMVDAVKQLANTEQTPDVTTSSAATDNEGFTEVTDQEPLPFE
jgi:hypothetical protein